jgi:ribose transport system permease protein
VVPSDPVTTAVTPAEPSTSTPPGVTQRQPSRVGKLLTNQQTILVAVLVILVIVFSVINPVFFGVGPIGNVLVTWAPIVLLAVGETFVIVTGGIDLSVGSTLTISNVLGAFVMQALVLAGWPDVPVLVIGAIASLAVGALVGTINAVLINVAKLVPFVATLALLGAGAGLALVLTGGGQVGNTPPSATGLSATINGGLFSWPVIFVIVIVTIAGLFLHKSRFGRFTYAIGGNAFAATASGISVKKHLTKVYILSGVFAGAAGFIQYLQLNGGSPSAGFSDELSAIAAVVIGGASLAGGYGKIFGTVLGALILETVYNGLTVINVDPNWNQVAVAILIAAAASLQAVRGIRRRRKA